MTVEYTVRRRLHQRVARAAESVSVAGAGGVESGDGVGDAAADAGIRWEQRLRASISVVAPLAFWVQYERLRLSRRCCPAHCPPALACPLPARRPGP